MYVHFICDWDLYEVFLSMFMKAWGLKCLTQKYMV